MAESQEKYPIDHCQHETYQIGFGIFRKILQHVAIQIFINENGNFDGQHLRHFRIGFIRGRGGVDAASPALLSSSKMIATVRNAKPAIQSAPPIQPIQRVHRRRAIARKFLTMMNEQKVELSLFSLSHNNDYVDKLPALSMRIVVVVSPSGSLVDGSKSLKCGSNSVPSTVSGSSVSSSSSPSVSGNGVGTNGVGDAKDRPVGICTMMCDVLPKRFGSGCITYCVAF